jgi:DNA-binding NarL/FixJ family response regulator
VRARRDRPKRPSRLLHLEDQAAPRGPGDLPPKGRSAGLCEASRVPGVVDESAAAERRRIRLFIADDHPAILDAIGLFADLEDDIDVVGTATNAEEALRIIGARTPEVAVLDVKMPPFGGIEVLRRLGTSDGAPKIILYTAQSQRGLLLEALDLGARGFLLKESPLAELIRAIRIVAAGGTYIDPVLAGALASPLVADRLQSLTKREREILRLLADGMQNEQVGQLLSISPLTVKTHVKNAMGKLEADTRTEAVASALRQSLIT